MMKQLFRKPIFWLLFSLISFICFAYAFNMFTVAFPIVNIDISTDRDQAITLADEATQKYGWGPIDYSTAVTFETDTKAQTFIELAGGGQETFRAMIKNAYYMPYLWHIRHFKEFEKNETHIYFTPQGNLYGFVEKISENENRPSLSSTEALELTLHTLREDLQIDMQPYTLIEKAKEAQLNGRIDRTFVFERADISLKEGRYRIKGIVSGDKVTHLKQFVKVPQAFTLSYKEMRGANNSIASAASIFATIFYLLIGCLVGIFILMRQNWIILRTPIKWALLVSGLQFLNTLNSLPLLWMRYQTQTGKYGFLLNIIVNALSSFVILFVIIALIFIAAESLTRKAFGKHVRLWDSWNPGIANSYTVLGHTVSAYLMIGIDLAFLVSFYYFSTTYLKWWTPLGQLADPDVLASYFPWLSPIAMSLQAGFVEEAQYRAIPLASAALLGERFGKKNYWIFTAFILQAIVFGAAHANYAAQPAYARLLELIVPSFVFAGLYLRFGLLTSVIMHYAYDVLLFALPIFISQAPGIRINQYAVLLFTFFPILIILYRRFHAGIWQQLTASAFNYSWHPTATSLLNTTEHFTTGVKKLNRRAILGLGFAAVLSTIIILFAMRIPSDAPPLKIMREDAIEIAKKALEDQNQNIQHFTAYARVKPALDKKEEADLAHRYIWQSYPNSMYTALTGSYLNPPHWVVRFLKFNGSLQERAEEYQVLVGAKSMSKNPSYDALSVQHKIAESIPGAQLTKKDARILAEQALIAHDKNLSDMHEVSATPEQFPARIDWTFVFTDISNTYVKEGEARIEIKITGDTLSRYLYKIHLPEAWQRNDQKERAATQALQTLCMLLIQMLCVLGVCIALLFLAYKRLSMRLFTVIFFIFTLLFGVKLLSNWPQLIAQFNTSASFASQVFQTYCSLVVQHVLLALVFASMLSVALQTKQRYMYAQRTSLIIGVIIGMCISAGWIIIGCFKPAIVPTWGYYNALGTSFPFLSFIYAHIIKQLQYTALFSFGISIINYMSKGGHRYIPGISLLCICAGLAFAGYESIDAMYYWLIAGSMFGILIFVLWYFFVRFSPDIIPLIIGVSLSFAILQQILFNIFPYIFIVGTISIALILVIALFLHNHLRELNA